LAKAQPALRARPEKTLGARGQYCPSREPSNKSISSAVRSKSGVRSAYKSSGFSERLIPQRGVKRCVVDLADEDRKIVGIVAAQGSHTDSEISQRQR
jgi:hypothetical protein